MIEHHIGQAPIPAEVLTQPDRMPPILFAHDPRHIDAVVDALEKDQYGAFPYNGPYAFLGRYGSEPAKQGIFIAKNRPMDKKLVTVAAPEHWHEVIDFSEVPFAQKDIVSLVKGRHALGMILPRYTRDATGERETEVMMWTEYGPLRELYDRWRERGGNRFIATSVNKSGRPTNISGHEVAVNFRNDPLAFIVHDVVNQIPEHRMGSTTILDMTKGEIPILHRKGNVSQKEVDYGLDELGLPRTVVSDNLKIVPVRA